ncbi:MAG: LysR family transcriptional regulator [Sphingosinicella sp.]|nr:LysR family transcriptional regulator [Sphingosinicella sp.]
MPKPLPPLDALRIFEACARHGNFTRASEELSITPTAVSLRIRSLEEFLNGTLFQRRGPRIALTDAGTELGEQMSKAMAIIRDAVDGCRHRSNAIRLTCSPTLAARWLLPRLDRYNLLPDAAPIILDASSEVRGLGLFDVAIRSGTGPWPGLESTRLMPLQGTPMLTPELASRVGNDIDALLRLPLIPDERWARWLADMNRGDARPTFVSTTYPTQDMAGQAARVGAGVALLSPLLFSEEIKSGLLLAPFDHLVDGPDAYWLLWPGSGQAPIFVEWLLSAG